MAREARSRESQALPALMLSRSPSPFLIDGEVRGRRGDIKPLPHVSQALLAGMQPQSGVTQPYFSISPSKNPPCQALPVERLRSLPDPPKVESQVSESTDSIKIVEMQMRNIQTRFG